MLVSASASPRPVSLRRPAPLTTDWTVLSTAPGLVADPSKLAGADWGDWIPARVPGTVAQALREAGQWDFNQAIDLDTRDWWFKCEFGDPRDSADLSDSATESTILHFDGLATLAEAWLNGEPLLRSDNMFMRHAVDVSGRLAASNELVIAFRSLLPALAQKRPRPRWKTRLVSHQQLRWIRTSLLGRIPGWSPPVAPVGPWRAVSLERRGEGSIVDVMVLPLVDRDAGRVEFSAHLVTEHAAAVSGQLAVGETASRLMVERIANGYRVSGAVVVENVDRWWPHTHGRPALHPCHATIDVDGVRTQLDCGPVGFRQLEVDQDDGNFGLAINGCPIFCRGACWTVADAVSLADDATLIRPILERMRDAGANMIRVTGTMVYPGEAFFRTCDELGLLVWQDFMFANMDYPAGDASFVDSVRMEVTSVLQALRQHPSVVVYCGNSEVEQQAAMMGADRSAWRSPLFSDVIPSLVRAWHPNTAYVPSTPSGGAMPFHVGTGVAHYYGVGAYRRPLADVRRAGVRFTSECLGFANVPEPAAIAAFMGSGVAATHDPRWKRRTPRDSGAGWDFEDIRDHYLGELFAVNATALRSFEPARYLDLSRVVTGEVMARVIAEWRSKHSSCRGGLVWFLNDLWPGAGWGIVDNTGTPKACFYYLRRAWQPVAVLVTDESLDGIHIHVVNDTSEPFAGMLDVRLLRDERVAVAACAVACEVAPHSITMFESDALLGAFFDVTYSYKFGSPQADLLVATLLDRHGHVVSEAFHFPVPGAPRPSADGRPTATARATTAGRYELAIASDRFLYSAHIDVPGYLPDDNYCHVLPGRPRRIVLAPGGGTRPLSGYVEALNLDGPVAITVES